MSTQQNGLVWLILMMIILYTIQGVIQGFATSISLFLASYNASWKQQGTYSWVSYPFSFKILWAPIIDSVYTHRIGGRHQTWLVPVQLPIGIILISLSFYLESLLINLRIIILTIIFFFVYFLIASQDIVVDGWSVVLFATSNPQW
jgi:PAT family acetyl-CoA transporter-like MFS transporter 1